MKTRNLLCIATVLLTSLSGMKAATTLTAWTFDNLPIGINSSPQPATGLGTASALGMDNSYNNTNSLSNPDIQSLAGSSSGGPNSWRIRGFSNISGSRGNGWSTNAPVGTQGAQFTGSTFGYYKVQVAFDVYATADAEANLQVQYSTDGIHWFNANITSADSGVIATNTTSPDTVNGTYLQLVSGWNNQVAVDLTGLSGVDNNPSFAIRVVNASTGADCVDTTGAVYGNSSGSWTLGNVEIEGSTIDTVADWNFDLIGVKAAPYNSPAPTTGSGTAIVLGMTNNYVFSDSTGSNPDTNSLAWADILLQGGSSTGPNSLCWRVRGGNTGAGAPNSGWNSQAPILTQGAEFDVSTAGYTNVICSFDVYFTTQAPDKICVLYTTDGWVTTNVANSLFYAANPGYILNNASDPNLVNGSYFYETFGQGWYNNIVVDLTGDPATADNPLFGFRVVNAGTGPQCQNFLGQPYNNLSGNVRFANVTVGGTAGTPPPAVAFDPNATVDSPFTNTYTDNPAWRTSISAIYVNGLILTNTAYITTNAGQIIFDPAKSALLQASGLLNISIISHGFGTARVAQPLAAGVTTKLAVISPAAGPSASGGTLTANPVFLVSDQYGNGTTNPYANVTITAGVGGIGGWTLGGDAEQTSANGLIAFTNLTATVNGSSAVSGAYLTFTVVG
ncbi:MAG: hemoblobin-interacting domain-containing protein, partial [Limisphaerales bacterium]